ncbi:uncharacterized protein K452DRAFT_245013 [Aplosporella prunicola CBS 121167]|uniref:SRP54-type proteins GTP-binding domain-containing protein n=1 Tax=Aplosporella prunicola CBS 121167 TaxID=1176127 RepID=A0A6A6BPN4_9PEZI|nr:uncharacterized protein K452DRAFT_245013 [Aplosporella prunicola CBS 121167]KAF2145245.1 hypothetical protein K452DRAFT_245013 [Aplosporella prunicola CBS 121167]
MADDKSEHCIPFILARLDAHRRAPRPSGQPAPPFFIGLNGVQGAGKTTLVTTLHRTLTSPPHSLPTAVLSIDDLYLPHSAQRALAAAHPTNPLVQHRGQPGTHDLALGASVFAALRARQPTRIPAYDKSAHGGQGDRAEEAAWTAVNAAGAPTVEVVLFEGWCVGFRSLGAGEVRRQWEDAAAKARAEDEAYAGRLGRLELHSVAFVDERLSEYDVLTDALDAFVHIDAEDTQFVYQWRLQQEAALRAAKGRGMSDEQVVRFVDGYYPAYELYTDVLRAGIFKGDKGRQLRLVVGRDRRVKHVELL